MTNQNSDLDQLSAAELRQRLIAVQEENQKLNMIVATLVSELMMPLDVIHSYGNLLLEAENDLFSPLNEKQSKAVGYMQSGAVRSKELLQDAIKILTKSEVLESLESNLVQDYQCELWEANQQLDKLKLKLDTTQDILQSAANEFMSSLSFIRGWSQLLLEHPESMGGPLNNDQQEGIEAINEHAQKLHEAIEYYIFDSLRSIEVLDKQPLPEAVTLAEIGKMIKVESELPWETAVSVNRYEARAIINLLARGWYQRNKGNVLAVTAVADGILRFRFPDATKIPSHSTENFVDGETGRLKFSERQRYFDSVGLATGLVEKYGGTVYAELTGEGTCHLSFTLPVYREES